MPAPQAIRRVVLPRQRPPLGQRLPLHAPIAVLGNSKNAATASQSYVAMALVLAGGRYYAGPFWKVSHAGDRVDDYRARLLSHALPLLRGGAGAGGMLVIGDATNDYGVAGRSATAIVADYRWMVEQVLADHPRHRVTIELTPRFYGAAPLSAAGESDRVFGNAALLAMAQESGWGGRLRCSDQSGLGMYLATSESSDGKHYTTAVLARRAADILAAVLSDAIDPAPVLSAQAEIAAGPGFGININPNWALADTSPDDHVADGFATAAGSGATVTFTASSGSQTLAKSGSATTTGVGDTVTRNITVAAQAMGHVYESIVPASHAASLGGGTLALTTSDTQGLPGAGVIANTGPLPPLAGVLRAAGPPIQPNGTALTVTNVSTTVATREAVGAVDTQLVVSAPWFVREVELDAYAAPVDMGQMLALVSNGASFQMFAGFAIANNAGTLTAGRANVAGGGWFKAGGAIAYQWEADTGGGFVAVGANQRTYSPGGASGSYRCRATFGNAFGSLTITSNTVAI